jgi:hypothetical protein
MSWLKQLNIHTLLYFSAAAVATATTTTTTTTTVMSFLIFYSLCAHK